VHVRSASTVADPYAVLPKDLVGRRSDTGVLDRVWTSDIAYPRTGQCRQRLCAVRDGCSRRSIGWGAWMLRGRVWRFQIWARAAGRGSRRPRSQSTVRLMPSVRSVSGFQPSTRPAKVGSNALA
jgi:hypothetical protein